MPLENSNRPSERAMRLATSLAGLAYLYDVRGDEIEPINCESIGFRVEEAARLIDQEFSATRSRPRRMKTYVIVNYTNYGLAVDVVNADSRDEALACLPPGSAGPNVEVVEVDPSRRGLVRSWDPTG